MPKMPEGYLEKRKDEILNACNELYEHSSFHDVTLKKISDYTSFSRPSIYNYYETIEEIFLALLKREYDLWSADLEKILDQPIENRKDFAQAIAKTLESRKTMLRILAMNLYEIEENTRLESLTDFKCSFGNSMNVFKQLLEKYCPEMNEEKRKKILYSFYPFLNGLYPYATPTKKQAQAMEAAGLDYMKCTIEELASDFLVELLGE